MKVREIKDKNPWENFISDCNNKTFLQSWNWGIFQEKMGSRIWRLGVYEGDNLLGASLVIKVDAKRGRHLLLPHGPMVSEKHWSRRDEITEKLVEGLKDINDRVNSKFLRFAPTWERSRENNKIFSSIGFKNAPMHTHPEVTWEVDLTK